MKKYYIHNMGENSTLGFFAEKWLKNNPDIAFNEYMEECKGTTEIYAYFYPSNREILDNHCIQKNKNFCDKHNIGFNLIVKNK